MLILIIIFLKILSMDDDGLMLRKEKNLSVKDLYGVIHNNKELREKYENFFIVDEAGKVTIDKNGYKSTGIWGYVGEQNITDLNRVTDLLFPCTNDTAFHCNARFGHNNCICHGMYSLLFVIACEL